MCMEISREELVRINRSFGGRLVREASLDFALALQRREKLGSYTKLAYLWRAILVDHPFSDGNKRTAVYVACLLAETEGRTVDHDRLLHHAVAIARTNEAGVRNITWRLKDAID